MKRTCLVPLTLLVAAALFGLPAQAQDGKPLAEMRSKIVFPDLSEAERQTVAGQARLFLTELYVNLHHKRAFYGAATDPRAEADALVANAASLTTAELENGFAGLFARQRDLHLDFMFPSPHGCYMSALPFTFEDVYESSGRDKVIVGTILARALDSLPADAPARNVDIGDELLAVDGVPVNEAVRALVTVGRGANADGGRVRALGVLGFRHHLVNAVPERDEVTLALEDKWNTRYTVTLPWLVFARPFCDAEAAPPRITQGFDIAVDQVEWERAQLYAPADRPLAGIEYRTSSDSTIKWGLLRNPDGRFGYVRLQSFMASLGADAYVEEMIRILRQLVEQDRVQGLIIDVRGNPGGIIYHAERLAQLFDGDVVAPHLARMLNSPFNHRFFELAAATDASWAPWHRQMQVVHGTTQWHSPGHSFETSDVVNAVGQRFYGDVAVLTDAKCFSACDIFAALMQDHGAATIYGQQTRTGAGGANVITHSWLRQAMNAVSGADAPLEALPMQQDMRVAWRQIVRTGLHEGAVIEDYGVKADVTLPRSENDVYSDDFGLLGRITDDLHDLFAVRDWSVDLRKRSFMLERGRSATLPLTVKGTDTVRFHVDGAEVASLPLDPAQVSTSLAVPDEVLAAAVGTHKLRVEGYRNGKRLWNAVVTVDILGPATRLEPQERLVLDFAEGHGPLTIKSNTTDAAQGWQVKDGALATQAGDTYADGLATTAGVFLDTTGRTALKLTFSATVDTEAEYDFFWVEVVQADGTKETVWGKVSGQQALAPHEVDLSRFAGGRMIVRFVFEADGSTGGAGVRLDDVVLE